MKTSSSQPPAVTIDVSAELVAVVTERAAMLVADRQQSRFEPLVTVDQLATALATTPEWVRRHQAELGAFRLSDGGGRNPIRFRVSDVERFLAVRRLKPAAAKSTARGWRADPDWALR
jgi:hypothetical protein